MKKIAAAFNTIILLAGLLGTDVSASPGPSFNPALLSPAGYFDNALTSINPIGFSVKSGAYKEAEDPLMRRGTQNTDFPQSIFFVLPFVLTAVFFIVLFAKKKK